MTAFTIASGKTINDALPNDNTFTAYKLGTGDSFLNQGTLNITSTHANPNVTAVLIPSGMPGSSIVIENDGVITIKAPNAQYAYGVHELSFGPRFINGTSGKITVTAQNAYGFSSYDQTQPVTNKGSINVTGSVSAYGLDLNNPGWTVTNSGTISIHSGNGYDSDNQQFTAVAVNLDSGKLTNSGKISAVADTNAQYAIGVLFTSYDQSNPSTITNSGDISAAVAIGELRGNTASSQASVVNNTGTIEGAIILGAGDDVLTNSGTITGDITVYDGNDLVTNKGTIKGNLYLSTGDDTYDGRGGRISGIVDGGSGTDTAIFSGNKSAYTITRNGIKTTVTSSKGTVTLDYFEFAKFDDGTVAIRDPNTIINVEPIILYSDMTIPTAAKVTYTANGVAYPSAAIILTSTNSPAGPSLYNAGSITATSTISSDTVTAIGAWETTTFTGSVIRNDGKIQVTGTNDSLAVGILGTGYLPEVQNGKSGSIVAKGGLAVAIQSWDPAQKIGNAGILEADGVNFAAGLELSNGEWNVTNSGTITAHSGNGMQTALNMTPLSLQRTGAVAVLMHGSGDTLTNTGTIKAYADKNNSSVIGITWCSSDLTRPETIVNYGTIDASQAIYEQDSGNPPPSSDAVIANYGTIKGSITLGGGNDVVTNTGTITGPVYLGLNSLTVMGETDNDIFKGFGGTLSGSIYGGAGNDTFYLGSGNCTVDGGSGSDTVVLQGRASSFTVKKNADGSTTITSSKGIDTLKNVEAIKYMAAPRVDFNADYKSDILLQNTNGQVAIWEMNGLTKINSGNGYVGTSPGTAWKVIGTGDFNGDGKSDILFQNTNGQVAIWEMNGLTKVNSGTGTVGSNPGTAWKVIATGDFNGDGKSDILFQNTNGQVAIWEMNGLTKINSGDGTVGSNPGTAWKVIATGDFNGDGKSDILFQNTNGQVAIWEMNGLTKINSGDGTVGSNPGTAWKVIGTGDFNGDGKSDILFQNTNGQVAIWEMNGLTKINAGTGAVGSNLGTAWKVVGTADTNGDGNSDILFQNTNGQIADWEMNGLVSTNLGNGWIGSNPGKSWLVATGVGG